MMHPPNFDTYIARQCSIIQQRRTDLTAENQATVIAANSPFELIPSQTRAGALLIHGLLDCPFSMRDIGAILCQHQVRSRAVLLPGHGTRPSDLFHISYQDWINTVQFGIESFSQTVDQLFLVGYSTGATLAIGQALQNNKKIAGLILLSPALQVTAPIRWSLRWHQLLQCVRPDYPWIYQQKEDDYAKYQSISAHAVREVVALTKIIRAEIASRTLGVPVFMIMSYEDETVSSHAALQFFKRCLHPKNQCWLYTKKSNRFHDARITTHFKMPSERTIAYYPHAALPFSPANPHYGEKPDRQRSLYRAVSYNPDFNSMSEQIVQFIHHLSD